ncbi:MAG: hypothetical protein WA006_05295 [Rhodoglobus sp.]
MRTHPFVALLVAVPMLTGCSTSSVATSTTRGTPPGIDASENLLNGLPLAVWLDEDRAALAVVTFGSSSCPPVPTSISRLDDTTLSISFVRSPDTPCTADLAATTHEFETPEGIAADSPVTAELGFENEQRYTVDVQDR